MDDLDHTEFPDELAATARRLREERPTLSGLELDQIKLQAQRRAASPRQTFLSRQRRSLMKSRMAITSILILGVLSGGTGTGLAISGVSDSGSAGTAQYPPTPTQRGGDQAGDQGGAEEGPDVLGRQEGGGGDSDVAGAQEQRSGVQATRQVSVQEDDSLPFTGLAAIPLILIGVGLLATGVVLHRRLPENA